MRGTLGERCGYNKSLCVPRQSPVGKRKVESFKPLNRLIGDTDSTIRQFDESTTNNGIATSAVRSLFTERSDSPPRNDGFGERHCEERLGIIKDTTNRNVFRCNPLIMEPYYHRGIATSAVRSLFTEWSIPPPRNDAPIYCLIV